MGDDRKRVFASWAERLVREGFDVVPGGVESNPHLIYRREGDLLSTAGLEFSARLPGKVTASLYLNRSLLWSFHPAADFPREAYRRIGGFLTDAERGRLLRPEYLEPGVVDAWWGGSEMSGLQAMAEATVVAVPRFLAQPGLLDRLRASTAFRTHTTRLERITGLVTTAPAWRDTTGPTLPTALPDAWKSAAERVLREEGSGFVEKLPRMLGLDAWRLWRLGNGARI